MAIQKNKKKTTVHTYQWQGINRKGDRVRGEYKGISEKEVKESLKRQGVNPTKLKKKPEPFLKIGASYKILPMDIAMVSRQLATMLTAGVPLVQSLSIVADGHEKPIVRELLNNINGDIQSGVPVADALRQHPRYFDDLYCDLVSVGEQSGSLEQVFERIATYKEKTEALKSKIKKALLYPTSVIIVAFAVTLLLLIFVVPQFESIFAGFGAELPAFTIFVLDISEVVQAYWYLIIGGLVAGGILFKKAHFKYESLRNKTDIMILKLPIIGPIMRKSCIARFS